MEEYDQQQEHAYMHRPDPDPESQPALRDPSLAHAEQVAVDHVGKQRKQEIIRPPGARIDERQGNRKYRQIQRRERNPQSPQ